MPSLLRELYFVYFFILFFFDLGAPNLIPDPRTGLELQFGNHCFRGQLVRRLRCYGLNNWDPLRGKGNQLLESEPVQREPEPELPASGISPTPALPPTLALTARFPRTFQGSPQPPAPDSPPRPLLS